MKNLKQLLRVNCNLGFVLFIVSLSGTLSLSAQTDTSTLKYKIGDNSGHSTNVDLTDPITTEYRYNPKTNRYEEYQSFGGLSRPTGKSLSVTEYYQKSSSKDDKDYLRSKTQSNNYSTGAGTKGGVSGLLNPLLDAPGVSKIFGEGGVDFQLSGSLMGKLGGTYNVNKNPTYTKRQQRYFNPLFEQHIQVSANGKIGQFMKLGINYDTEAQFDFDNQTNLGWAGKPTGILKGVQVGNVSFNTNTQLIKSNPNLFGFATDMQFGKTTVKTVFSQNKGQSTETVLQGGQQLNEYRILADNYDQNKHYFLSQFFKDKYDDALKNLPLIQSGVIINRVEVWVTNRNGNTETPRDILCFQDLGERNPYRKADLENPGQGLPAKNNANQLYSEITSNTAYRNVGQASAALTGRYNDFEQGVDYDILNYARMLREDEYSVNKLLGYISLNQALNNDEILAVAFEYTYKDSIYKVGEFSRDVSSQDPNSTSADQRMLFLKMLKGNTVRIRLPIWDLMMKNIYSLNTYNLTLDDFRFNIIYADDTSGADYNYLPNNSVDAFKGGKPFIQVFGFDHVNRQGEAKPDGVIDITDNTINLQNARIIFPVREPFGTYMRGLFGSRTDLADFYCFDALYDSTKWLAQQDTRHNKFYLTGSYKSSVGDEIFLGTTNLQQGSVQVTANGRKLNEGSDYEVDYTLGRVRIINKGLLQSGAEIRASANGQSFFNIQQKTLIGTRIEHRFSKNVMLGGTAMHMWERPLTSNKTNYGEEPLLNTIVGADFSYSNKSRLITKLVDKLPFIETKQESNITAYFEAAQLFAHNHRSQGGNRGISNLEDFENAELPSDFKMASNWVVSSIPQKQPDLFPETASTNTVDWTKRRAKLAFYSIDQLFYRDLDMPDNIKQRVDEELSNHYVRQISQSELFPLKQFPAGSPTLLPTFDLSFYPKERGIYNFNTDPTQLNSAGELLQPNKSWAGIMRRVDQNDFEAANIDYIELWIMDPLMQNPNLKGDFYINLGSVSEDVLPDKRKAFENGLPTTANDPNALQTVVNTPFGKVSTSPQINNAFNNDPAALKKQDVGLDGLSDADETGFHDAGYLNDIRTNFSAGSAFYQEASKDPANDNFKHYLDAGYDDADAGILQRYKNFNNMEGNSNRDNLTGKYSAMPNSSSPNPNDEDVNRDFTMNQSEDYYQYKIPISVQDLQVGKGYVVDAVRQKVNLRNNKQEEVVWYQLKIPIRGYQKVVGNISDFKSIRFMRMFLTNFNDNVVMRFGYINLVRADWRRYQFSLSKPGAQVTIDPNSKTKFVVSTVNLEENANRSPFAYVSPPGVTRVQNIASLGTTQENEQGLSLVTCGLTPGDARAAFKTTQFDIRNYKNLQLFVHAEALQNTNPVDGDLHFFLRFGTDLTSNYYEYEIPLKFTRGNVTKNTPGADKLIWPDENFIDIVLQDFYNLKISRLNENWPLTALYSKVNPNNATLSVIGLPDASNIRSVILGVKNVSDATLCTEVWVNELRVKGINNKSGGAALGSVQAQLADLGNVNLAGSIRSIGFGDVDKKLNERNLSTNINYDIASNINLGKFFPQKLGFNIPMYIGYSETYIKPKYFPLNPDLELQNFLNNVSDKQKRKAIQKAAIDYNSLYSFNINNIVLGNGSTGKKRPWNVSNFTGGYGFTRQYRRNQQIEEYFLETTTANLGYTYGMDVHYLQPFKKLKPKWLAPIRELNLNLLPSTVGANISLNRTYAETQMRNNNSFKQINPRLYDKNFVIDRNYNFNLPLTRDNIEIGYTARAQSRIQEPYGAIDTREEKQAIRHEFKSLGRPTSFYQNVTATYTVPLKYIPALDWIRISSNYNGSYQWNQAIPAFATLGNTIQNSRDLNATATLGFTQLYSKIPWLRDLEKPSKLKSKNKAKAKPEDPGYESALDKEKKGSKPNPGKLFIGRLISMLKNASTTYSRVERTLMPGFSYQPDYFGQNFLHSQPGLPFALGWQYDDIRYRMANSGALNKDTNQYNFYNKNFTENITGNVTIEPLKDFRLTLDFSRSITSGTTSNFKWNGSSWIDNALTENGTYNISGIFIRTIFVKDEKQGDYSKSPVFKQFLNNRYSAASSLMLADERVTVKGNDDSTKYPTGYSSSSQSVLIGNFYAIYSGQNLTKAKYSAFPKIPLPNWNLNYNGLTRIKALGKIFNNINIKHAYTGRYSMGSYTRNLEYKSTASPVNKKDFVPKYNIPDVTISDGFNPLIGISLTTKSNWNMNFEYKKYRTVRLFAPSYNITENKNNEISLTGGYRVTGVTLPFRGKNGRKIYLPNDFKVDLTVSVSDQISVVRMILINSEKITSGMKTVRISPNITYQINNSLNIAFRYNRMVLNPKLSTTFYTAITDFGLELRYTLQ